MTFLPLRISCASFIKMEIEVTGVRRSYSHFEEFLYGTPFVPAVRGITKRDGRFQPESDACLWSAEQVALKSRPAAFLSISPNFRPSGRKARCGRPLFAIFCGVNTSSIGHS